MEGTVEHNLYVTWRQRDRRIVPVGRLTQRRVDDDVSYRFVYLKVAETLEDFRPLAGLTDLHEVHLSEYLFPVFANRQMPRNRPDFSTFVEQLDLTSETDPFEILGRSGGRRATDRIEVFSEPTEQSGNLTTLFFARGIRHVDGAAAAIEQLQPGDTLVLLDEPENPVNARAILINTQTDECVGYIPDYLLSMIHELRESGNDSLLVTAEHVNPRSSVPHMRLLCRLTTPWPAGYAPFSEPEMLPIVSGEFV